MTKKIKQKKHNDIDFDEIELLEIEENLNQYLVKYPDQDQVNSTIETLHQYLPSNGTQQTSHKRVLKKLMKHSINEFFIISKTYWVSSLLIFIFGYLITLSQSYDPTHTLFILAPLPFVIGLTEIFKGREHGLLEMEMTCKFASHEIMLSRLILIGIFNILLNSLFTILFEPFFTTGYLIDMIMTWLVPLTLFSAVSLYLSMNIKGSLFVVVLLSLWLATSLFIVSNPVWFNTVLSMNSGLKLAFIIAGLTLFSFQIKQITKKYAFYDGDDVYELSY